MKPNFDYTATPKSMGYFFPSEWHRHEATWLTYPHNEGSFPGKMETILPSYHNFIRILTAGEKVRINVNSEIQRDIILKRFTDEEMDISRIELFIHPSDDVWCRDHGPSFVIHPLAPEKKAIVKWDFNAWGGKYPFNSDRNIPLLIAEKFGLPVFDPGIIMEGGSVDLNGDGTLITTTACLLNKNRNPGLTRDNIETILSEYYNVSNILWLGDGIDGDDTDGHIDDIARFVARDKIVTVTESKKSDKNYEPLKKNLELLKKVRIENGKQPDIIELPMPDPVIYEDTRLPASYANFYISNIAVIVPTFRCKKDEKAMEILSEVFPKRKIVGIDSTDIVWGFGSFHCLSQQEPFI